MFVRRGIAVCLLGLGTLAADPATAYAAAADPVCRLLLYDGQSKWDELVLESDLARADLAGAEEIFGLLDELWSNNAVERLAFLGGKHERDAAALRLERQELLTQRQEAEVAQLRILCPVSDRTELSEQQLAGVDSAYRRQVEADCGARTKLAELAEVDLAYMREVLASVRDLRHNDVATRQDVILSERNVEKARTRVAQGKLRVDQCRRLLEGLDRDRTE